MSVVWKYDIQLGLNDLRMPAEAEILSAGAQGGTPRDLKIWARVDPLNMMETRQVLVIGTGQLYSPPKSLARFIGTVFQGPFVWHVFELL